MVLPPDVYEPPISSDWPIMNKSPSSFTPPQHYIIELQIYEGNIKKKKQKQKCSSRMSMGDERTRSKISTPVT